jgi:hypothetical protein
VKQQHTSTATSILTTKSTCRSLSAQRVSERTVQLATCFGSYVYWTIISQSNWPDDGSTGTEACCLLYCNKRYVSVVLLRKVLLIAKPLLLNLTFILWIFRYIYAVGARSGAVGWGTVLQTGRSRVRFPMVSLEFVIGIILPAVLRPWGWLSL